MEQRERVRAAGDRSQDGLIGLKMSGKLTAKMGEQGLSDHEVSI
jgi:hypothetical protein